MKTRDHGDVWVFLGCFLRVINEELTVVFEARVEGNAQEAFFVLVVSVLDARADVEERLHFARLGVVRPDEDGAVFARREDAVRAVAGTSDEKRSRIACLADITACEPIGPGELWKGRHDFDWQWSLINFRESVRHKKHKGEREQCRSANPHDVVSWVRGYFNVGIAATRPAAMGRAARTRTR